MEELLSSLFVLYILGSIVAGFFRRGKESRSGEQRPGFPEVLDMDELERRLREVRSGERESDVPGATVPDLTSTPVSAPEPTLTPAPMAAPAPERAPGPPAPTWMPQPPRRVPKRGPVGAAHPRPATATVSSLGQAHVGGGWDDDADWDELPGAGWEAVSGKGESRRRAQTGQLPAAVQTFIQRGHPWQAAFVVKELLGPPRALQPHSRRPRL